MNTNYYQSPVGWLKITTNNAAVISIDYVAQPAQLGKLAGYGQEVIKQLDEYFANLRKKFDLKLARSAPDFTWQVWQALDLIPYGQTWTYLEVAKKIGRPQASRAVGNACHVNPIAIVVPCHRVVGSSPQAGGYASGAWRKKWLIKHEQKSSP